MVYPSFLLAKLYVKGSLKNVEGGFEFSLKNLIDSTMLSGIGPVAAGGKSYDAAAIAVTVGERRWEAGELSPSNAVPVPVGVPLRISVRGESLAPGQQRVNVAATSSDVGLLKFDISDTVA